MVPLVLGIYWKRSTSRAALTAMLTGSLARLIFHFTMPAEFAGLDTLLPPALSLIVFVAVSMRARGDDASPPLRVAKDVESCYLERFLASWRVLAVFCCR